jgi:hypothetical protein
VTDLEKLVAIEEIKQLKARRVRCMDEKDWDGYAACHTPNAVSYTFKSIGRADGDVVGAQAIAEMLKGVLTGRTTCHQIHAPEIDLTSDTTAKSIWPMEDMLWWEENGESHWLHGYGHYRQTYERIDGKWLIASRALSRIKVDSGVGERTIAQMKAGR